MNTTIFSALAEPNRLEIVELLLEGPLSVGEIADKLQLNQPQASKHLRSLSHAGLVEKKPVANKRIYQLQAGSFQELDEWLSAFRRIWDARLDRLEEYLEKLQSKDVNQ